MVSRVSHTHQCPGSNPGPATNGGCSIMVNTPDCESGYEGSTPSGHPTECSLEVRHLVWDQVHVGSNPIIPTKAGSSNGKT